MIIRLLAQWMAILLFVILHALTLSFSGTEIALILVNLCLKQTQKTRSQYAIFLVGTLNICIGTEIARILVRLLWGNILPMIVNSALILVKMTRLLIEMATVKMNVHFLLRQKLFCQSMNIVVLLVQALNIFTKTAHA